MTPAQGDPARGGSTRGASARRDPARVPSAKEERRRSIARGLWSVLGSALLIGTLVAFGLGRPGLGVAFLVGVAICLGGLTRSRVGAGQRSARRR